MNLTLAPRHHVLIGADPGKPGVTLGEVGEVLAADRRIVD